MPTLLKSSGNLVEPALLAAGASLALGVLLPVMMTAASKSSPFFLAMAGVLSVAAVWGRPEHAKPGRALLNGIRRGPAGVATALLFYMLLSAAWAHDPADSLRQYAEFMLPLACGAALALAFPLVADQRRLGWWMLAAAATALIIALDIRSGLPLRHLTGGRATDYSYNRALVTLVMLIWPLAALAAARGRLGWVTALILVPAAVQTGESQTAVLGLCVGAAVFPIALLAPRMTRRAGVVATVIVLALSPAIGTIAHEALGPKLHKALEAGHSEDRVNIWLSFEAAASRHWLFGSGFGSSRRMQESVAAQEIAPERVPLLGAGHPHNAFLQLWVELGLIGAVAALLLFVSLFSLIGRAPVLLQPYLLTWVAVVASIALVSHGAWQAWWVASIGAGAAGFAAVAAELRDGERQADP